MSSSISSSDVSTSAADIPQTRRSAANGPVAGSANGPRRFFASLVATIVLGLAILWAATATLREGFLEADYAIWQAKRQMIAECRLADTVILGDSRASADFIPGEIPQTVNFGLGGGTPIEFYHLTRAMMACPRLPKRVLLSISMEHLTGAEFFWSRTAMFGFLSFADVEDVRRRSRALRDPTIFAAPTIGDVDAIVTDWLYAHHFPSFSAASLLNAGVIGRFVANRRIGEETARAAGQHFYGTSAGSSLVATDAEIRVFTVPPVIDEYLRRTLALLADHGTQVVFIGAPMNQATYARVSPAAAQGFRRYLAALTQEVPNFRIVGDPMPHWDDKWFGDRAHLNEAGAKRFSAQVMETLSRDAQPDQPAANIP